MTTRPATAADVPSLVEMGVSFLSSVYVGRLVPDVDALSALVAQFVDQPDKLILVLEDRSGHVVGMFGAMVYAHPMSGERIASELCWWVDPGSRGGGMRLLKDAESWAKAQGATCLQMIAPTADVERFYQRVGFEQVETIYQRRIA